LADAPTIATERGSKSVSRGSGTRTGERGHLAAVAVEADEAAIVMSIVS
jgi:hypothetical protein